MNYSEEEMDVTGDTHHIQICESLDKSIKIVSNPLYSEPDNPDQNFLCTKFNIIGESLPLLVVLRAIKAHGRYDAPVLVTGETGTGKELVARGIHYNGKRSSKPFIAVNCATFTSELFNSEIYGHKKGSFTDAKQDKKGLLHSAEGGTLFLDEIDSLNLESQASLLRFLQESEYRPVGSDKTIKADVRLIASVNSELKIRMEKGEFRRDLYYRLYVFGVHMPPLRDRKNDIPILAKHFLTKFSNQYNLGEKQMSANFVKVISERKWPGNVRELENFIHRMYLLNDTVLIDKISTNEYEAVNSIDNNNGDESVHFAVDTEYSPCVTDVVIANDDSVNALVKNEERYDFSKDKKIAIEYFEKNYVSNLLAVTQGNVTRAAKLCGKDRRAFGKLVKKYNAKALLDSM